MKQRILQFIDFKGLSTRKFSDEVGISHSLLGNNSALGSDKLEKISAKYPELNMDWVINGRGAMLYEEMQRNFDFRQKAMNIMQESQAQYNNEFKENYELLKKEHETQKDRYTTVLEKLTQCMEERDELKRTMMPLPGAS